MNILFVSLLDFDTLDVPNLYTDLLRELYSRGHTIYAVSPSERRTGDRTRVIDIPQGRILKLRVGNIQKTNVVEKGLSTLMLGNQLRRGIRRYFRDVRFELVLFPTPPITVAGSVRYVKRRDGAQSYLLLKDIFPQNAVDIGMMGTNGLPYRYFRRREQRLYALCDYIGCMSPANADYLLAHNPQLDSTRVEVCPNSIDPREAPSFEARKSARRSLGISDDTVVFLYGGNLGRPQDVPFIVQCLQQNAGRTDRLFLICGSGTDAPLLRQHIEREHPSNVRLYDMLPPDKYRRILAASDVGLIFLDHRFTIPNFPSRLLSYMEAGLPVLACTDRHTDVGKIIEAGGFGWWCESGDPAAFTRLVDTTVSHRSHLLTYGQAARTYLEKHYTVAQGADIILRHFS